MAVGCSYTFILVMFECTYILSKMCVMPNRKTEDGCGRGNHVASYSVIYDSCSRQILPALQAEHTVEYVTHYKLKEINILSLLARTIVMLSLF